MDRNLSAPEVARLAEAMSEISERCWYAGWLKDTEFVLWSALQHGPKPWGHGEITEADIRTLKALSEAVGGWVRWSDDGPEDEVFVDGATWGRLYHEWAGHPARQGRSGE